MKSRTLLLFCFGIAVVVIITSALTAALVVGHDHSELRKIATAAADSAYAERAAQEGWHDSAAVGQLTEQIWDARRRAERVNAYIHGEAFLDSLVTRINGLQLSGGR